MEDLAKRKQPLFAEIFIMTPIGTREKMPRLLLKSIPLPCHSVLLRKWLFKTRARMPELHVDASLTPDYPYSQSDGF